MFGKRCSKSSFLCSKSMIMMSWSNSVSAFTNKPGLQLSNPRCSRTGEQVVEEEAMTTIR